MFKANAFFVLILLACCTPGAHAEESWQSLARQAQSSLELERYSESYKYFKHVLAEAQAKKVPQNDPLFREIMLESIPNLIEKLTLEKNFERAEELAQTKLNCAEKMYGAKAPYTLDALQDLQSLYSIQKRSNDATAMLMKYAETVTALREDGRDAEVDDVVKYRNDRLKRKLRESFERIQKRFVPASKGLPADDTQKASSAEDTKGQ